MKKISPSAKRTSTPNTPKAAPSKPKGAKAEPYKPKHSGSRLQNQLAAYLRQAREKQKLGLLDFAEKLGVSHTTLHYLLRGQQNVRLHLLQQIMERMGCRLGDIFPEADQPAKAVASVPEVKPAGAKQA
jgi:DNA-binding Xre family transcriptional regulator